MCTLYFGLNLLVLFQRRGLDLRLFERQDVIDARAHYLRMMKKYREQGCNIVWLDETWINQGHVRNYEWTDMDKGTHIFTH